MQYLVMGSGSSPPCMTGPASSSGFLPASCLRPRSCGLAMILSLFIPSGDLLLLLLDLSSFLSKFAGFGNTCDNGIPEIIESLHLNIFSREYLLLLLPSDLLNLIVELHPGLELLHLILPVWVRFVYNSMPAEHLFSDEEQNRYLAKSKQDRLPYVRVMLVFYIWGRRKNKFSSTLLKQALIIITILDIII